jgi:hypothetical protein
MNANNTELIDIILASCDGKAAGAIALAGNFPIDASEKALKTLVRDIASKMAVKTREPEEMELLLDVIEAGEHDDYLSDPDALLSREAIQEGEEILAHVYGSLERARTIARSLRRPHGMSEANMERMMSLAATLCVAGLVKRGQQTYLAAADTGGAGSTFWAELVKAVIKGVTHVPAKRRRRRNRATYANSYKRSRKRTRQRCRSRRKKTPGLADVFGELLKRAI